MHILAQKSIEVERERRDGQTKDPALWQLIMVKLCKIWQRRVFHIISKSSTIMRISLAKNDENY